jgi:hypothetical protein
MTFFAGRVDRRGVSDQPPHIREAFAGDLPPETTALMAATQHTDVSAYAGEFTGKYQHRSSCL